MKLIIATVFGLAATASANSQEISEGESNNVGPIPATEIYLASLNMNEGKYTITAPKNITQHKGYDNQPYFSPDNSFILYTSEGTNIRTDIWKYSIKDARKTQITNTPENSEFSPKVIPDGSGISVIRERKNRGGQKVWRYPHGQETGGEAILDLSPLGYHAWGFGTDYLSVFVQGNPDTLQLIERSTGRTTILFENIGRGLFSLPDGSGYTFTEPKADGIVLVHHHDIKSGETKPLFTLPKGNEFYALLMNTSAPLGVSFMSASGSIIYFRESLNSEWHEIADLSDKGISSISRLAVSPNRKHIAIVAAE